MLNFKFVDFCDDIIDVVISSNLNDKTVIIFPNHKSMQIGIHVLQPLWEFQDIKLIHISELNTLASITNKPIVQDAKRYLLFYQSLSKKFKEKYNLTEYFASIQFIGQFFHFFTELHQECIDLASIEKKLVFENFFAQWQVETWDELHQMYHDYKNYLLDKDFTDSIFTEINFLALDGYFANYEYIVFANQFYFTAIEKKIINWLKQTKQLTIFYQLPENLLDKKNLTVKDFTLKDLITAVSQGLKINLISAPSDFTQIKKMIELLDNENIKHIVDYDYLNQNWFKYLSPERFALPNSFPIHDSEIFQFFKIIYNLFNSMQYVPEQKKYFLPLYQVFIAFNYQPFKDYFTKSNSLELLFRALTNKNYLYFDPYNLKSIFKCTDDEELKSGMQKFANLIINLMQITSMNQLIQFIKDDDYSETEFINIRSICPLITFETTDILEKFYEALANLHTIEEFGIVKKWDFLNHTPLITSILHFFLEFIKPTLVNYKVENNGIIDFLTLVDTRNLMFDKILFLNVSEGILPKSKSIDFLLNEKQRSIVGLKTYDEVRLREKYYFFRTILSSFESFIIYIENEDDNIEKSSFVEELQVYMKENITQTQVSDTGYKSFYEAVSSGKSSIPIKMIGVNDTNNDGVFYESERLQLPNLTFIPSDFDTDFKQPRIIELNTYSIMELLEDPMSWFVNINLGFNKFRYPDKDRIDHKLIGNIIHAFMDYIHKNTPPTQDAQGDDRYLKSFREYITDKTFDNLFYSFIQSSYLYKYPYDFSGRYFKEILLPIAKQVVINFFHTGEISKLSGESIVKIEYPIAQKLFIKTSAYQVLVSGRLDMVILDKDRKDNFIIDFKTGKASNEQLIIYNWLLMEENIQFNLKFLNVFQKNEIEQKKNKKNIEDIMIKLKETIDICYESGYFYPESKTNRKKFIEINRTDKLINN